MLPLRYLVVRVAAASFIAVRLIGATPIHAQAEPASELPVRKFLDDRARQPVCSRLARPLRRMYGLNKPAFGPYYDSDAIARRRQATAERTQ